MYTVKKRRREVVGTNLTIYIYLYIYIYVWKYNVNICTHTSIGPYPIIYNNVHGVTNGGPLSKLLSCSFRIVFFYKWPFWVIPRRNLRDSKSLRNTWFYLLWYLSDETMIDISFFTTNLRKSKTLNTYIIWNSKSITCWIISRQDIGDFKLWKRHVFTHCGIYLIRLCSIYGFVLKIWK